jgi:hypothetical protein
LGISVLEGPKIPLFVSAGRLLDMNPPKPLELYWGLFGMPVDGGCPKILGEPCALLLFLSQYRG